jgi:Domain of unknown function (DUF4926)
VTLRRSAPTAASDEKRNTAHVTFPLLQVVELLEDRPGDGLRRGTIGTVVDALDGSGTAYEVEVVDKGGQTTFVGPLPASALRAV